MDDFVVQIIGEIGRRPEIIRGAIAASNEEKKRSLRPLKTRLTELQRRHKQLGEELQRYLQIARQSEGGHFGHETLAAAEDLSKQKHEMEREIEKVKIDISFRERVVADEMVIADKLLAFERTVSELPFEERRELLRLLLRQVRVNRLNPEKDRIPDGPHTWDAQIRIQWYTVKLGFFASDLLSVSRAINTISGRVPSHLRKNANFLRKCGGIAAVGFQMSATTDKQVTAATPRRSSSGSGRTSCRDRGTP